MYELTHTNICIYYIICVYITYIICVYTSVCVCIKQLNKNEPNFKYGKHTGRCE